MSAKVFWHIFLESQRLVNKTETMAIKLFQNASSSSAITPTSCRGSLTISAAWRSVRIRNCSSTSTLAKAKSKAPWPRAPRASSSNHRPPSKTKPTTKAMPAAIRNRKLRKCSARLIMDLKRRRTSSPKTTASQNYSRISTTLTGN